MKKQILIDTDMGNDDIMAIAMMLLSNKFDIVGISTVKGVSNASIGAQNLNRILNYCDYNAAIVVGANKALKEKQAKFPTRDSRRAENLILLKSLKIPLQSKKLIKKQRVENFIFEKTIKGDIQILALGPLTNIARTIEKYGQEFCNQVQSIVIMGGGINKGNVSPFNLAEYNIWIDPEAAKIVFKSNIPIYMVGIDATKYVPATSKFCNEIRAIFPKSPLSKIIKEIIINNDNDLDQFYDPLAAAILISPSLIEKNARCQIDISLTGNERGKTKAINTEVKNVEVIFEVNRESFYELIINLLK